MKSSPNLPIRILTHNIRYATTSPFPGEELWPIRLPRLLNELRYTTLYNPEAFICLQEVLHPQLLDILTNLNANNTSNPNPNPNPNPEAPQEWSYIGVARDDGHQAGEYSPVLYRPAVWSLLHFRTVWLSPTPDVPSKGWDAASIRLLTIGVFKHRASKQQVVALNTHLDDQGSVSRLRGAEMIVAEIERLAGPSFSSPAFSAGTTLPVFLAGDLNSEPAQEAYEVLNGAASPVQDALGLAGGRVYGHGNTFTGFVPEEEGEAAKRIDFLFVGREGWRVRGLAGLESRFEDGVFVSDHRAVVGDFVVGG
ncbi:endonuclease/exonuclease/phosphatase [Mytilinidion resinicola]|uniref:Endonuclease/exonuclease/phosphatase n=1 Tax=Mytilinidion resinicola TaxID=574789 RepID=A0A6A6YGC0_9PEZI|nr:endonuclease/exonuclease/phosphatase [Mytilinidion resinicola]KAF2807851.1 endonuclease/exonuclease/phosphatase [Mytilinidion resinicola]